MLNDKLGENAIKFEDVINKKTNTKLYKYFVEYIVCDIQLKRFTKIEYREVFIF